MGSSVGLGEGDVAEAVDFTEDLELEGTAARRALMEGAASETSQLHCGVLAKPWHARVAGYPEEFAEGRVIWLARLALDVFEVLGEPEAQDLEHAVQRLVGVADGGEGFGAVEVRPVLEVGRGF